MAAEESGSYPNSLAKTYQPRGRHTTLFGVSKQGEPSNGGGHRANLSYLLERLLVYITRSLLCLPSCLHQGSMWSYCVNEEVLRLGLARTAPIVGLLPDSQLYWRLHKRLHRAEVRAERSGRGLWKQDSLWERVSKTVRDSALFGLMRRIFKRT